MENNKTHDWFATRLLNEDKGLTVLLEEGVTPLTSNLQAPDFYKGKTKVQEAFMKPDGNFDDDAFTRYYDDVSKEYEYLSSIDTENLFLDYYEKSNADFTTPFGRRVDHQMRANLIANPQKQNQGLVE